MVITQEYRRRKIKVTVATSSSVVLESDSTDVIVGLDQKEIGVTERRKTKKK